MKRKRQDFRHQLPRIFVASMGLLKKSQKSRNFDLSRTYVRCHLCTIKARLIIVLKWYKQALEHHDILQHGSKTFVRTLWDWHHNGQGRRKFRKYLQGPSSLQTKVIEINRNKWRCVQLGSSLQVLCWEYRRQYTQLHILMAGGQPRDYVRSPCKSSKILYGFVKRTWEVNQEGRLGDHVC